MRLIIHDEPVVLRFAVESIEPDEVAEDRDGLKVPKNGLALALDR